MTIYFARGFTHNNQGKKLELCAAPLIKCKTADEAIEKALKMFQGLTYVVTVAVALEYNESTKEFGKSTLLAKYGDL